MKFNVSVERQIPHLLVGDEIRIRQCVMNLLTNAVKYTEAGEVDLAVSARKTDDSHISLCFTRFYSMLSQSPDFIPVLPLADLAGDERMPEGYPGKETAAGAKARNIILYEPDSQEVFDAIVPEYLAGLIYGAVCESTVSELAARRMAMEAATNNAEEMIEKLNLHYNRARQASITQEITEIVAGAEGV